MNVDSDNFHEVRKFIRTNDLIKKSKYISFDLQFTGVRFDNNQKQRYDMFLNDKYQKMASVANKFNIIQVGLTFIVPRQQSENNNSQTQNSQKKQQKKQENNQQAKTPPKKTQQQQTQMREVQDKLKQLSIQQNKSKYIAYPYNFYVFPRKTEAHDPVISMQAGCVQFNTSNNMDWNRWIRKGITYVRISDINKQLQSISNSSTNNVLTTVTNSTTNTNQKMYLEIFNQLNQKTKKVVEDIIANCSQKDIGYKYTIEVSKSSVGYIRRAIQRYADQNNINFMLTTAAKQQDQDQQLELSLLQSKTHSLDEAHSQPINNLINLTIQVISEQRRKQEQQKQKQAILGFTLIFQEIWMSDKTIIGHNCLYDLLFVYSAFVNQLPRQYQNFKKILCDKSDKKNGKQFYDTKYLAGQVQMDQKIFKKGTSLQQLYKYYKQKLKNQKGIVLSLAPGFQTYDLQKPALHEAGFDSYLTSWVFLHVNVSPADQGKLCIFKSYFFMNLRTQADQIRKDMKVFVIAIVLNNAYVPYDQLRTMRITQSKLIRDELVKQNMLNDVVIIDGFKEIFINMKQISKTDKLVQFLIGLKKDKIVNSANVMSLETWVKMKAEVTALMAANNNANQNKILKNL